jgi:hypothetical protein
VSCAFVITGVAPWTSAGSPVDGATRATVDAGRRGRDAAARAGWDAGGSEAWMAADCGSLDIPDTRLIGLEILPLTDFRL